MVGDRERRRRFAFALIIISAIVPASLSSCRTVRESDTNRRSTSDIEIVATAATALYRDVITAQDTSRCVFTPSCSHYMEDAIRKHGFAGIFMGMDRLTRCHPLNAASGRLYERLSDGTLYDPVE